jgi:hypothetical protein
MLSIQARAVLATGPAHSESAVTLPMLLLALMSVFVFGVYGPEVAQPIRESSDLPRAVTRFAW